MCRRLRFDVFKRKCLFVFINCLAGIFPAMILQKRQSVAANNASKSEVGRLSVREG